MRDISHVSKSMHEITDYPPILTPRFEARSVDALPAAAFMALAIQRKISLMLNFSGRLFPNGKSAYHVVVVLQVQSSKNMFGRHSGNIFQVPFHFNAQWSN